MSGVLIALGLIGLACSITAQYFAAKAAVGFAADVRHKLFERLTTLSFFGHGSTGNLSHDHPHDQRCEPDADRREHDAATVPAFAVCGIGSYGDGFYH